ncbi:MAG: hypothetical protein ABH884_00310 [Candidatus Komeilibacteria bacterium]
MNQKLYNFIAILLIVGFFTSAFFGCILYVQSMSAGHHGQDSQTTTLAKCCDMEAMLGDITHIIPAIMVNGLALLFIVILVASILFVQLEDGYYVRIREKYGGFNLYNYFVLLFQKGIIHPKVY